MNIKDFTECFCGCKIILNNRDTSHFICGECTESISDNKY